MLYYKIISKIHNNGKIESFLTEILSDFLPRNIEIDKGTYDYYEDYFLNEDTAKLFHKRNLALNKRVNCAEKPYKSVWLNNLNNDWGRSPLYN